METKRERIKIPIGDGLAGLRGGAAVDGVLVRPAVCQSLAVVCEDVEVLQARPELIGELVDALLDAGIGCLRVASAELDPVPDEAGRGLVGVVEWLAAAPETRSLALGAVGIGRGVNHVLAAAAEVPQLLGALVGLAPRPEGIDDVLDDVIAPTLLAAESWRDREVLDACRLVVAKLRHAPSKLVIGRGQPAHNGDGVHVNGNGDGNGRGNGGGHGEQDAERLAAVREAASHARIWLLTHLMPEELGWMAGIWPSQPPWSERLF